MKAVHIIKFVNMFSMANVNIQIPESIAIFSKTVEILNTLQKSLQVLHHISTTKCESSLYPRSILNSSAHFVTVLKLAVFELPTPLFVGCLRGGSSSVSLFYISSFI